MLNGASQREKCCVVGVVSRAAVPEAKPLIPAPAQVIRRHRRALAGMLSRLGGKVPRERRDVRSMGWMDGSERFFLGEKFILISARLPPVGCMGRDGTLDNTTLEVEISDLRMVR
jgi:hypothetical protein